MIGGAGRRGRSGPRPWPPCSPPATGHGGESEKVALERGCLDAVIAGLLFMAGMRRSEVSALRWAEIVDSTDGDGVLVSVRRSKTNQEGEVNDVRLVKNGVARALRTLRAATTPEPSDRVVPLSAQMMIEGRLSLLSVTFPCPSPQNHYWVNSNTNSPGSLRSSSTSR